MGATICRSELGFPRPLELARRWNARAAALGLKSAEIKKLRKAKRAPDESLAA